jgi:hypothetical protein
MMENGGWKLGNRAGDRVKRMGDKEQRRETEVKELDIRNRDLRQWVDSRR